MNAQEFKYFTRYSNRNYFISRFQLGYVCNFFLIYLSYFVTSLVIGLVYLEANTSISTCIQLCLVQAIPFRYTLGDGLSMLAIRLQALRNKAWNLSVASFVLRNVKRVKPRSLRSTISLLNGGNSSESLIHFILTSFLHHFGIVVDVSNNLNIAFIIVDNDSV